MRVIMFEFPFFFFFFFFFPSVCLVISRLCSLPFQGCLLCFARFVRFVFALLAPRML